MVFKTKKYSWCYQMATPADIVGAELEKIEEEHGEVNPSLFLESSRDEKSPTHMMFEWNDRVASEKYRLYQSGNIIRNLRIEYVRDESESQEIELEIKNEETPTIAAYMNTTPKGQIIANRDTAHFVNSQRAMISDEIRKTVINNAMMELKSFERKYRVYNEFASLFTLIDELEQEMS